MSTDSHIPGSNPVVDWARDAYAAGALGEPELEPVIAAALRHPPESVERPRRTRNWGRVLVLIALCVPPVLWHTAVGLAMAENRHDTFAGLLGVQLALCIATGLYAAIAYEGMRGGLS